jgi:hypothetical protein
MDDNARPHRNLPDEELLESEDITRMDWPAYSPYLNPIKHVWDALGETHCSMLTSSEEHPTTQADVDCGMGTPTARNVAPAVSEHAETVLSNQYIEERAYPILRNICLLFFLLDRRTIVCGFGTRFRHGCL